MEHACSHLPDAEMLLELYARHGGFEVSLTDPGTEYDESTEDRAPGEDEDGEGGRGMAVVRASVDEVEYVRTPEETNKWRLVRNRRHPTRP